MVLVLVYYVAVLTVFFFKQKTAYEMRISDWSSDVCSSDLAGIFRTDGDAPVRLSEEQYLQEGDGRGSGRVNNGVAPAKAGAARNLALPLWSPRLSLGRRESTSP